MLAQEFRITIRQHWDVGALRRPSPSELLQECIVEQMPTPVPCKSWCSMSALFCQTSYPELATLEDKKNEAGLLVMARHVAKPHMLTGCVLI